MNFIEALNEKTGGKYAFLKDNKVLIAVGERKIKLVLIMPASVGVEAFGDDDKRVVFDAAREILPASFEIEIDYKRVSASTESVRRDIVEFFNKNFLSLINKVSADDLTVEIDGDSVSVEIAFYTHFYDFAKVEALDSKLATYLSHCVCGDVKVKLSDKGAQIEEETQSKDSIVEMHDRIIKPEKQSPIYGKEINRFANYICDCTEQAENTVLAGRIIGYSEKIATKNKTLFYCFNLTDTTGSIPCRIFTKKPERGVLSELKDDDVIIAAGNIRYDEYSKQNSFIINSLARCDIDFTKVKKTTAYKSEAPDYLCVRPQPYNETAQATFFGEKERVAEYLKSHEIVVFDFETTGLSPDNDMLTEIGAVKLINGAVTEYFSTFVNPCRHIPAEVSEKTHITDEMVKDAPKIEEVIGDFYKFTRGAVLAGHNITGFDMLFLRRFGEENNYLFDNNVKDTLDMARRYLAGLPNYKLGTVCEHLNIPLEGAHRAYNDCVANAKVFKHLAKFL